MIAFDNGSLFIISQYLDFKIANKAYETLLNELHWQSKKIFVFGRWIEQPRLIDWNADTTYYYSKIALERKRWHPFIFFLKEKIKEDFNIDFNHALINLYRNENDSIAWHADDEKQLGEFPVIASYSLGESRRFLLCKKDQKKIKKNIIEISLHHNDLMIMYPPLQKYWYHSVPKERKKRGSRINISFRKIILNSPEKTGESIY